MRIALLCGGPSLERGISLNSARSVLDHLASDQLEIVPVYFDQKKRGFLLSPAQLYSNTPSDFDFKLAETSTALSQAELITTLKSCDIAFPAMHGGWAEDGGLQRFLERNHIPFVGSGSGACKRAFDKHTASLILEEFGFEYFPTALLRINQRDHLQLAREFFAAHGVTRAIVKPATGGSSIGVFSVASPEEAVRKAQTIFAKRMDTRVVIEPFAQGCEFTVIILQNRYGLPVAILPTEMEIDYAEHQVFDFRKKYLPTRQVTYHCPPRFSDQTIDAIQVQAEHLFTLFGMRDFARFDGWVLDDGRVVFNDFNPISGMEQNSFLFQQGARVGLSHRELLRFVLARALQRNGHELPAETTTQTPKTPLVVLFGGSSSERQVSLMSGTNVWLKLLGSTKYAPTPYLWGTDGTIWKLPYAFTLNHTVEEIEAMCLRAPEDMERLRRLVERVHLRLSFSGGDYLELPTKLTLEELLDQYRHLFLALHGGQGENGELQALCEKRGIAYNGSSSVTSALCMDKHATANRITECKVEGLESIPQFVLSGDNLTTSTVRGSTKLWKEICAKLQSRSVVVKPLADGCSSGVAHLYSAEDLRTYLGLVQRKSPIIPPRTFRGQEQPVELPPMDKVLVERFIKTDAVSVRAGRLKVREQSGWIEVTVGVVEQKDGTMHALHPSLTVAEGAVLSLEEKFQGGTGINITPPPPELMDSEAVALVRERIAALAAAIGLTGYARIDAFIERSTGRVQVIEINTLPGLTPSTVLYHQGLAEEPPIYPRELLEKICP